MPLPTLPIRDLLLLLCLCLLGCQQEVPTYKRVVEEMPWKAIQVGGYVMDFPADFKLVEEDGIDSYVGKVEGDSISFFFDFGYYSNDLGPTPEEYLQDSSWLTEAGYQFLKPDTQYTDSGWPKIEVLSIRKATEQDSSLSRGCDYVARCLFEKELFEHPIYLPEEAKQATFTIDTIDYQYRRLAVAKPPYAAITGMYIRDVSSYNSSINGYLALSITTDSLTKEQQELALKIFSTVRKAK